MRYNWGRQPQENIHDIKHGQDQGVGEHKLAAFVAQLGLQVLVDILPGPFPFLARLGATLSRQQKERQEREEEEKEEDGGAAAGTHNILIF